MKYLDSIIKPLKVKKQFTHIFMDWLEPAIYMSIAVIVVVALLVWITGIK